MREIHKLVDLNTRIIVTDEKGSGGANHCYQIIPMGETELKPLSLIKFQEGGVVANGVNGCTIEDLLYIVQDRLECFQAGDFACQENEIAKTKIEESLMWLHKRTLERQARGVEGLEKQ